MFCFSDFEILSAVISDQLKILKLFLEGREDKNPIDDNGDILCIKNLNPIDDNGNTLLSEASSLGYLDVAEYYIKNGYKASSKVYFLLFNPE